MREPGWSQHQPDCNLPLLPEAAGEGSGRPGLSQTLNQMQSFRHAGFALVACLLMSVPSG